MIALLWLALAGLAVLLFMGATEGEDDETR